MKKTNINTKKYFSPFTVIASIVCIALAAFILGGYISLNELTLEEGRKEKELTTLQSQNEVLSVKIENKNSLGNIEQIATEQLGMVKLDSHQIHMINLAGDDSVEIITEQKKNGFFDGIVASFNIILEYLD